MGFSLIHRFLITICLHTRFLIVRAPLAPPHKSLDPKDTVLENALLFLSEDHETMAMAYNFFTEEGGNEVRKWK